MSFIGLFTNVSNGGTAQAGDNTDISGVADHHRLSTMIGS